MNKLTIACLLGALVMVGGCVQTLAAQGVPITLTAYWNPNPATDNVVGYLLSLDGGPQVAVPPTLTASCSCIQQTFSVTTFGAHTVSVVAQNLALSADPTSLQSSPPFSVGFTLSPSPSAVQGGKVRK